jgi:hypothetical protein
MEDLYFDTKNLNKTNKQKFNTRKAQINKNSDLVVLQSIITETGLLAILSQSVEFLLEFTEKFSILIQDESNKMVIKERIRKLLRNQESIDISDVKTSRLDTLIKNAKKSGYFNLKSLELLDEVRKTRNYFVHNFLMQNIIDFYNNSAFKKKALKILVLTNILLTQLINDFNDTFMTKTSMMDSEITDLFSELKFNFTNNAL